eukprot:12826595-Alexandrium_andersonii.AAC.1
MCARRKLLHGRSPNNNTLPECMPAPHFPHFPQFAPKPMSLTAACTSPGRQMPSQATAADRGGNCCVAWVRTAVVLRTTKAVFHYEVELVLQATRIHEPHGVVVLHCVFDQAPGQLLVGAHIRAQH